MKLKRLPTYVKQNAMMKNLGPFFVNIQKIIEKGLNMYCVIWIYNSFQQNYENVELKCEVSLWNMS